MKNKIFKAFLSTSVLFSMFVITTPVKASPMFFFQLAQMNTETIQDNIDCLEQPCAANNPLQSLIDDNKKTLPQEERVITKTQIEIVEDDTCDCVDDVVKQRIFPKYAFWGLPLAVLLFGTVKTIKTSDNISPNPVILPPNPIVISPMRP